MKILKFIKKNYKRLIIQVVSIISAFVIFSVSASADTFDYSINMPISKPNITENTFYVEVLYNNGISGELDIISYTTTDGDTAQPCIYVNFNGSNLLTFSGTGLLAKMNCYWITSAGNCGVYNNGGGSFSISYSNVVGVKLYGNFELQSGSAPLPNGYAWNFNYSSDAVAINQLDTIIGLLQSQNSSNNQINESVEQSADKISGSVEESTNEILNGYESKPDVDGSSIDNTISMDNQIIQDNSNGINSAIDFIEGFTLGNVNQGMLAVTNVFDTFVNIPWFNEITRFSLLFGVFAFILGLSIFVISKARKR